VLERPLAPPAPTPSRRIVSGGNTDSDMDRRAHGRPVHRQGRRGRPGRAGPGARRGDGRARHSARGRVRAPY
jgi:hypothetical protein